ncbi:MAG: hypothetical protein FWF81_04875, partial [Defluviitaleaceae bacterium]|nr:hypothetical protein [Defluviitaleaceae bacterium]
MGNSRRLSKDYEISTHSAEAMAMISHITTLLNSHHYLVKTVLTCFEYSFSAKERKPISQISHKRLAILGKKMTG